MIDFKNIDEKIMIGYDYLMERNAVNACDAWLDAWEAIKKAIIEAQVKNITELQAKYNWTQFLSNYVQDLEAELHNAGLSNIEYFQKRIAYCEEMLELCGEDQGLLVENTRRAIADRYLHCTRYNKLISASKLLDCGCYSFKGDANILLLFVTGKSPLR